jgi:hypothetical protein
LQNRRDFIHLPRIFGYTKTAASKEKPHFVDGIFMTLHTTRPLLGDSFCAQTFRNKQINKIIAAKETKAKTK